MEYSKPESYWELWHIQCCGTFRTTDIFRILLYKILGYLEQEAYSEPCRTLQWNTFENQLTAIIIFASYKYFCNISFSWPAAHEINLIFNTSLIFTPEVFIICQRVWGPRSRSWRPWILIYLLDVLQFYRLYFWLFTFSKLRVTP